MYLVYDIYVFKNVCQTVCEADNEIIRNLIIKILIILELYEIQSAQDQSVRNEYTMHARNFLSILSCFASVHFESLILFLTVTSALSLKCQ